jgi:hypothetical protein
VSDEANGAEVYLYVISCGLERIKIGVASDARKRLRELQVGSPVELKLALTRPYAERRDADAVAQELYRSFGGRRVRGSWYRLAAGEVRERLGQRASLEAPRAAVREHHHKQTARQRAAPPRSKLKPPTRRDAKDARRERPRRSRPAAEQTHAIDVEQAERDRPSLVAEEQANAADPSRSPTTGQHDGVPIFPDTPDGYAARLAYYEERKLNNLPNSLYDYHDAKRGDQPPAERRAREQRDHPPPR